MKKSSGELVFDISNTTLLLLICLVTLFPFINTLAISFNDGIDAARGGIYFLPRKISLASYGIVFTDKRIVAAFIISITKTILGIIITVCCTGLFAYALSKKNLLGRKYYLLFCVFNLVFFGGIIPNYLVYRDLGLTDNYLVYILPGAINIWYMILMKTFFEQLPEEIEESAKIEGCGIFRIFFNITIPLSKPIIATICVFVGVDQWNSWFDAYLYVSNEKLFPLQTYLYKILAYAQSLESSDFGVQSVERRMEASITTIRSATVIVTMLPILFIFSFFNKYFQKGIMVGAIKG